jgi:NADH dehydrogenase/NADH:ubiquinone oxidoreductase subunit G
LQVSVEKGTTILEAARFLGFPIPTLCHMEGLSPYGACRLCVVEIGEGARARLVTSCTYPVEEGLVVRTASSRVVRARRMILELLLASCPQSKVIQDLAAAHNIRTQRFKQEHEDCILCGLCVRMCEEQMMAKAIGFRGRGDKRSIGTPFDVKSEQCRLCGGCIYICPACTLRCTYNQPEKAICGGCANLAPPCLEKEKFNDMMCYMDPCVACEIGKGKQEHSDGK